MKNKFAILLTAIIGFAAASMVFAQESTNTADTMEKNEMANTEMNEGANEEMNEAVNAMPATETAPAANTEAPAPSAY